MTEPGLYSDIPERDYHAATDSLSHSGARLLLQSPARFRWDREHPSGPTDAMDEGSALHALVLESEARHVAVKGGHGVSDRKAAVRSEGGIPLSEDAAARVEDMARQIWADLDGRKLLQAAPLREMSGYAEDPKTGVMMRCRYDALHPERNYALDLKTTRSIAEFDSGKPLVNYGYAMQAAWYSTVSALLGRPVGCFLFLLVEKEPPYFVAVRELDEWTLAYGHAQMRRALDLYAACQDSGQWPGPEPFKTISAPSWALRQEGIA